MVTGAKCCRQNWRWLNFPLQKFSAMFHWGSKSNWPTFGGGTSKLSTIEWSWSDGPCKKRTGCVYIFWILKSKSWLSMKACWSKFVCVMNYKLKWSPNPNDSLNPRKTRLIFAPRVKVRKNIDVDRWAFLHVFFSVGSKFVKNVLGLQKTFFYHIIC